MKQLYLFSKIVKELREANKWTQEFVAKKIDIAYQSYQNYERGITLPSIKNLIKLADLFDVSIDYLLGRKEY